MEKKYKILILLFVVVAIVTLAGFYKSYLRYIPDFSRFNSLIHIHFVAFSCWLILVIIQPALIMRKKYSLHRKLGKCSYLLAPLLVITIILLAKEKLVKDMAVSEDMAAITAFIALLDVLSFSACYLIAVLNKRNIRWHVAFIIGATLVVLNPGMSRLLNLLKTGLGMMAAIITPFAVPMAILVFEKIRFKRQMLSSPYSLFILLWTLQIALFITIPQTPFWHNIVAYITGRLTSPLL